jgi:S-DNA-T family DNA segregation ATPase FtsK/SpoIIIE
MKRWGETMPKKKKQYEIQYDLFGVLLIVVSIYFYISLFSESSGFVGSGIKSVLLGILGLGAYVFPLMVTILGIAFIYMKGDIKLNHKYFALVLFTLAMLITLYLVTLDQMQFEGFEPTWTDHIAYAYTLGRGAHSIGGGALGAVIGYGFVMLFGKAGSIALTAGLFLISVLIFTETSVRVLLDFIKASFVKLMTLLKGQIKDKSDQRKATAKTKAEKQEAEPFISSELVKGEQERINEMDKKIRILDFTKSFDSNFKVSPVQAQPEKNKAGNVTEFESIKDKAVKEKAEKKQEKEEPVPTIVPEIKHYSGYTLPPTNLLNMNIEGKAVNTKKEVMNNVRVLEETLGNFGVSAKVSQVSVGPAITRYELSLSPGVKVSKIVGLSDDISLGLAAAGIRIEAPIPGKSAVGIEVPNKDVTMVYLREVLESEEYKSSKSKLSFGIGKDVAGADIVADLGKMPHLLIAGATGSGKSVCINTLIASILYKATPDEVKLLMIDPKVVELSIYKNIPHLLIPVVTDPKKAAGALNWAVVEMTERYKKFAANNVRDITGYNAISKEGMEKMPQIVVIIDELADLMMVSPGDVEDSICRLAQMARAAGIHLVVATQRPSVDVITGLIKANIPSRISFAVSSQVDSRTILDMGGAEKLLGKGDMLFYPVGESKPLRVQGAFVSEKEIEKLVNYIKEQVPPSYNDEILKNMEQMEEQENVEYGNETDELLPTAIEMVVESGQASIMMLQRRLKVGYSRAARLIDQMEERGVIGGHEGSKPRKVLMSKEEFNQRLDV